MPFFPSDGHRRGSARLPLIVLAALGWTPELIAQEATSTQKTSRLAPVEVSDQAPAQEPAYIQADKPAATGKLDVPVARQPFAIEVVGESLMRDTGAKNIQDALLYSPGVYSGGFGFDTRVDSAKVRGLDPSFYVDGLRYLYGSYNSVRPNIYALESIEVLKGPSSVLYGQAELGGIINGVSKLPKPTRQGELWAQVGSYDRKQVAADITGPLSEDGKLLYRLVALKRDSGTQVDHVDDDGFLFAPSITWLPTDDTTISLLMNSQEDTGAISAQFLPAQGTLLPGPLGDIGSETFVGEPDWDRYDRRRNEVTLFVDHRLDQQWGLVFTGRYSKSEAETREHWAATGEAPAADGTINRVIYMDDKGTEVKNFDLRLKGNLLMGPTRHHLAIGVDRQDALWKQDNTFRGAGTPINVYDPVYGNVNYGVLDPEDKDDNELKQTGVYLIDHVEIGRVAVSGAVRYDDTTSTTLGVNGVDTDKDDHATTGRLGLMYNFDFGLSPYISYSESFKPNLGVSNGRTLDPTTGEQREAGIKYLSEPLALSVTAAWFDIEETNRIIPGQDAQQLDQTGATVDGWEIGVKKQFGNLSLLANYTKLDAKKDSTGERLPYVAEEVASGWGKYEMENGLRFGAGVRYLGSTVGNDYGKGADPKVPSVTLYDAMIGYSTGPWDFSITGKNLADKEYVSWCRGQNGNVIYDCGYGERRVILGDLRYRF
ncbi:TonB-dependent siderophore receptor [Alloalcanivorax gelatiniphagus]|uniref:TonB-dependent siderophore receptor n=1 Tax=Alloalcanivorax gelatiniphagus TaxID=1194167 RepID=A0ABY2XHH4_9GAMM|nr:TonB-dependent siderophore receptor [Alloalcanivorax gelatiniphagus]TMW11217.1 TonB-dependent siderophore receptor [Alloalcanivorax gelatiniphagus]